MAWSSSGEERLEVDGWGVRRHEWGPADWWAGSRSWGAGRLDDGTWLGPLVSTEIELDKNGLIGGGATVDPVSHAPWQIPHPSGAPTSRLATALCRLTSGDREGWGWVGRLQPA